MPHGTPDWGLVGPKSTVYGLDDLGEHAVRLGSPHLFDRRGDVLWMTDFDEGLGDVWATWTGGGGSVHLVTGYTRKGAYAVKLTAGTAGTTFARIRKDLFLPVLSRMGLEVTFSYHEDMNEVRLEGIAYDGVNAHYFEVTYVFGTQLLLVYVPPGVWQPVAANVRIGTGAFASNTMKIVADLTTDQYVRLLFNGVSVPVAGVPLHAPGDGRAPYLHVDVTNVGSATTNPEILVDCVIVTQNEP